MGNWMSPAVFKRVIWCDTEGGVRGVPVWDVTFMDECTGAAPRALRFFDVSAARKGGRQQLRKCIPAAVYTSALKTASVYMAAHEHAADGSWGQGTYTRLSTNMADTVREYLQGRKGCVVCAWNMRAHDKYVLRGLVGRKAIEDVVLWDALPWFRSKYTLPKNTLSSDKPGTPRNVFGVTSQGNAHTSLADAAHLREVVLRAAYCLESGDTKAYKGVDRVSMLAAAMEQVDLEVDDDTWLPVSTCTWDVVPDSVKSGYSEAACKAL